MFANYSHCFYQRFQSFCYIYQRLLSFIHTSFNSLALVFDWGWIENISYLIITFLRRHMCLCLQTFKLLVWLLACGLMVIQILYRASFQLPSSKRWSITSRSLSSPSTKRFIPSTIDKLFDTFQIFLDIKSNLQRSINKNPNPPNE